METKTYAHEVKSIEDRTVTGIAAVFGNVDLGSDRIHLGAFRKTIKENLQRVRHLWMHDPYNPPTAAIKHIKEIKADELPASLLAQFPDATGGLEVARDYLPTQRGEEILQGIRAGAINEMSFGFDVVKYDVEEIAFDDGSKRRVRNLRELRLYDTSDVTWGMNPATMASKAAPILEAYKDQLPAADYELYLQLVNLTDSAFTPDMIKAGRVLSARNLERLKSALDVLAEILLAAEPPSDDEDEKALTAMLQARLQLAKRYHI